MAIDPVQMLGLAQRPKIDGEHQILDGLALGDSGGSRHIHTIATRPGQAGWKDKIPPPEPDGTSEEIEKLRAQMLGQGADPSAINIYTPPSVPPPGLVIPGVVSGEPRLVVSFGPQPGTVIVGIERAPTWDMDQSFMVSLDALRELLPLLGQLTRFKDLTGGALYERGSKPGRVRRSRVSE